MTSARGTMICRAFAVVELEDVLQQVALLIGEGGGLLRGEQEAELLLAVRQLVLARRLDADHPQQSDRGLVQQPDRSGSSPSRRDAADTRSRARSGGAGGSRTTSGACSPITMCSAVMKKKASAMLAEWTTRVGGAGDLAHQRLDDPGERRLAHPAEREARERDSELARREVGVEMIEHVARQLRRPAAARHQRVDLGRAELDERELRGDEEAVQEHQQEAQAEAGPGAHIGRGAAGKEQNWWHGG